MDREDGYYWVKDDERTATWTVGHWAHGLWTFPGSEEEYEDSEDLEISERLRPPE